MKIELSKFGKVLTSRPSGQEAYAAIRPTLGSDIQYVEVDFTGVLSLSPSWADEFFTALKSQYGEQITFLPSDNPSVKATLNILGLS